MMMGVYIGWRLPSLAEEIPAGRDAGIARLSFKRGILEQDRLLRMSQGGKEKGYGAGENPFSEHTQIVVPACTASTIARSSRRSFSIALPTTTTSAPALAT